MIDIEKIKQAALASPDNWNSFVDLVTPSAILELITRLEAAESQLAAQELVIHQLRDALEKSQKQIAGGPDGSVVYARNKKALAIPTSTEHLEAWYKSMVGEPVAWNYELTEEAFVRLSVAGINVDTPLHAIKPFKGE